jgi:hypothetical protein
MRPATRLQGRRRIASADRSGRFPAAAATRVDASSTSAASVYSCLPGDSHGRDESVRDPVQSKHQSSSSRDSTTSNPLCLRGAPQAASYRLVPLRSPVARCDVTHAIRFDFRTFLGPFHGPLHWVATRSCTESTLQPRDGGTDFTYVLQGHSPQRSWLVLYASRHMWQ